MHAKDQKFSALFRTSLLLAMLYANPSAADEQRQWSVSPYIGMHQPSLKALNQGAFQVPYEGTGSIQNQLGGSDDVVVSYQSPLPAFNPGTLAGLEFQWRVDNKNAFFLGAGAWEATSFATSTGSIPIQGVLSGITAQRKGDMSYREYYLGWHYNLRNKPKKYNLYATGSLHQIYDVNYLESFTMVFVSGPPATFRKSLVTTGHGTGAPLLQGGVGGEWFLTDWLSIGMDGAYELSLKNIYLSNGKTNSDILDTDSLTLKAPIGINTNNLLTYKSQPGGAYKDLQLDFGGWKVMMKVNLYY